MSSTAILNRPGKKSGAATKAAALAAPDLIAPLDGMRVDGSAAVFNWEAVESATSYWLQVASDDAFRHLRFDASVGETTSLTLYASLPEDGSVYYWRVRAGNAEDWYVWSAPSAFTAVGVEDVVRREAVEVHAAPAAPIAAPAPAGDEAEPAPYRTGTTSQGAVLLFVLLFVLAILMLALILVTFGLDAREAATSPASAALLVVMANAERRMSS